MDQSGIIIGGGIGGLVAALCLNQRGVRADVYEQAAVLREVGAGLVLSPNALFVLDRLGLKDALYSISWPSKKWMIAEANGRTVQELDVQALENQYGYGTRVVHRGKLQRLLLDSLHPGQLHTGCQLTQLLDDGRQVSARFTNGLTAKGTCLIGADGIRSTVRSHLFGDQSLRYSGQSCWRAIVNYALPIDAQTTATEYWGRSSGLRVGVVPSGPNELYVYVTVATPAKGHDTPGTAATHLQAIGQEFTPLVSRILDTLQEDRIYRADLYDLPTLPTWSSGRCTLLGDAAHATTPNIGQGACQAIEDALVVAACLSQTTSVTAAFSRYESIRKPKAGRVVTLSRQIGQVINLPGWLKPLIFAAMRASPKSVSTRQFDAIYSMDYVRDVAASASQSRPAPAE